MTQSLIEAGRSFMGMSLAFHIAIALFGVGIPLLICLMELIGIVFKDSDYTKMAKRWTFTMAVFFVSGAISGTVVAVTFAVLLPPFMTFISKVVILPFTLETFAFFIEAIFLGMYVYSWDRFGKWAHWLCSLPIVVASAASAFFITTVNAFMNALQGFTYQNGIITNVNQWKAMFNAAVPTETSHSILAYYATTAFVFAAIAAAHLLWHKKTVDKNWYRYYRKMIGMTLGVAFLFSLAVVVTGDSAARYDAYHEPEKFAAGEDIMKTQSGAPLTFGGIQIPDALSLLVGGSENTVVTGLDAFDASTWPPLIIHYFFDAMAAIGMVMALVPILFFASWKYHRHRAVSKLALWLVLITGILSIVAVELGWLYAEIGRQPYTIRGIMLTQNAFTSSPTVYAYAVIFPIFYLLLTIATIYVLRRYYKNRHD